MHRGYRRVLVLMLAAAGAASAGHRALAQDWVVYAPSDAGYSVEFPTQPRVSTNTVSTAAGPAQLIQALVEVGDSAYIASHIDYAPSVIASRTMDQHLDAARDGQLKGGMLLSEQRILLSGHPARHMIAAKQGYLIVARTTLVGRRLFQFAYIGKPGTEDGAGPQRFLNSLRIVQQ